MVGNHVVLEVAWPTTDSFPASQLLHDVFVFLFRRIHLHFHLHFRPFQVLWFKTCCKSVRRSRRRRRKTSRKRRRRRVWRRIDLPPFVLCLPQTRLLLPLPEGKVRRTIREGVPNVLSPPLAGRSRTVAASVEVELDKHCFRFVFYSFFWKSGKFWWIECTFWDLNELAKYFLVTTAQWYVCTVKKQVFTHWRSIWPWLLCIISLGSTVYERFLNIANEHSSFKPGWARITLSCLVSKEEELFII